MVYYSETIQPCPIFIPRLVMSDEKEKHIMHYGVFWLCVILRYLFLDIIYDTCQDGVNIVICRCCNYVLMWILNNSHTCTQKQHTPACARMVCG